LRIAALTAAGAIGMTSRTEAAVYYWQGSEPGYYQQSQPVQPPRRQKVRRSAPKKDEKAVAKETTTNPQGPLTISVSIAKQQVKIYDDNGVFAEAPVSTGMPGHPTPMGVFSVIQKHKFHHSNIYSGAPMPYMQRITWSGVAMHAGVLPGYPASHGCIRMPMAFAMKMWNWTKMGARVFVTPGEIPAPVSFAHAFLPTQKVAPPPPVAEVPPVESHAEVKADKGAPEPAPAPSEVKLELRSTVGHNDKPVAAEVPAPRDQTRTAEIAVKSPVTMTDAQVGPAREQVAAKTEPAKVEATKSEPASVETKVADAGGGTVAAKPDGAEIENAGPKRDEPVVAEAKPSETASADVKPIANENADKAEAKAEQPVVAAKADGDDARAERPAASPKAGDKPAEPKAESAKAEIAKPQVAKAEPQNTEDAAKAVEATIEAKVDPKPAEAPRAVEAKPEPAKPEAMKAEAAKPAEKSDAKIQDAKTQNTKTQNTKTQTVGDAPTKPVDAKKDQTRLSEAEKPAAAKPEPPKRSGQIAVFISRKDSKLYVRQNFEPLFQVPVTIAPSDRPLGTHVFTAEVDKIDSNLLHWTVVSIPAASRAARDENGERVTSRRRKGATPPPVEAKPLPAQNSPAEALDRITVPQDAMVRFAEALATGGSIIVSDQGINQGETGEGTDFIVRLH
jgi:lipoprotein-anchoring transpeptidase ErfK/SrfK